MITFHTTLPEGVPISNDLQQRARCYVEFHHLGKAYYAPVTSQMCRTYGIKKKDGVYSILSYSLEVYFEEFLSMVVAAIYLQVRDTVGSEVHAQISEEIKSSFERMFSEGLSGQVRRMIDTKLSVPSELPGS